MKAKNTNIATQNANIMRVLLISGLILLLPLIAMQFTNEVAWTLADFVVAGILLVGTGLVYELAVKRVNNFTHRSLAAVTLIVAFLAIWAELAVGIFD